MAAPDDTAGIGAPGAPLWDAHCHLDWFGDPALVARQARGLGLSLLAVTVTPEGFAAARDVLGGERNVRLAAGLHPWWVREPDDARGLERLVGEVGHVGEVGLDASARHASTLHAQVAAFERVCVACARAAAADGRARVLSVHAVRSAGTVLDILERTGAAARCRCVLHWFSGSAEELWRAVRLGCSFSLGERALATRRGREWARVLPADRLLTETDLPPERGSALLAEDVAESLLRAARAIARARGADVSTVLETVAKNAGELLD